MTSVTIQDADIASQIRALDRDLKDKLGYGHQKEAAEMLDIAPWKVHHALAESRWKVIRELEQLADNLEENEE